MIFNNIYRGKTVLVTGHTGFKGSWISLWLHRLGANVIGYGLEPYTKEDNFVKIGLSNIITDIRGDIRDFNKLKGVFIEYQPEFVFHLAAQPLVSVSYEQPRATYEVNVMGTMNVLECIRETESVKVAVIITTDKCYENKEQIWAYREIDPLGGFDPYSSSKGCVEILVNSYRNSFFNSNRFDEHRKGVVSVRAGNVIGGGDWSKDRILPDCIRALIAGKDIEVRNPKAVRPWQFVLEPLSGYLWVGAKLYSNGKEYSGAWNFGPNDNMNLHVKDIVEKTIKYYGKGAWMDISNPSSFHEANLLSLDCTKAKKYLGWYPVLNVEDTFQMTVDWYKNYTMNSLYDLCCNQIREYEGKARSNGIVWIREE